jgi:hypothetical protein
MSKRLREIFPNIAKKKTKAKRLLGLRLED